MRSPDYRRGNVLRVHLIDNSSVEGTFLRSTRTYLHLQEGSIEGDGRLVRVSSERVLVPVRQVKLVEVMSR
jgi:hypothetical protein